MNRYFTRTFFKFLVVFLVILGVSLGIALYAVSEMPPAVDNTAEPQ